ncbi:MAG: matrixin family metalloprotease [Candidatus Bathyarchaeales archaeon]
MRKFWCLALECVVLLSLFSTLFFYGFAAEPPTNLMVVEWYGSGRVVVNQLPSPDDSMTNPDYSLLPFWWQTTINYWVNPKNKYGFSTSAVVATITAAAETWDANTIFELFAYQGTTSRSAGRRDGYNVVAWGLYPSGQAIAVTYIWYRGDAIIETDTIMNTRFKWSLTGEAGKMDVQNIMTHEFGHWCGLDDLYDDKDYWLTMYGYASYGETYKQTLGLGDILGLQTIYGK